MRRRMCFGCQMDRENLLLFFCCCCFFPAEPEINETRCCSPFVQQVGSCSLERLPRKTKPSHMEDVDTAKTLPERRAASVFVFLLQDQTMLSWLSSTQVHREITIYCRQQLAENAAGKQKMRGLFVDSPYIWITRNISFCVHSFTFSIFLFGFCPSSRQINYVKNNPRVPREISH